ncbi:MAG: flagellar basal body rod protein FlgC [Cyanobacteria bacterium NC_groundwater_1444_Ag_S-0.65um_54_12]|nr:flagellar basal body rod protein FlgC [Cyanobacteria bacterium NC_groundwater_1444_Ag_S-0.65um_54_12]
MSIERVFDIGGSALSANRLWLELIANNMANAQTTRTPEGGPYRRKLPVFTEILDQELGIAAGVQVNGILPDQRPFQKVYRPGHPDADKNGFVLMPDINIVTEMVDMIAVQRSYDANVTLLGAVKSMTNKSMEIGR